MNQSFTVHYNRYSSIDNITDNQKELVIAARKAVLDAYNPYSKFFVGCSVLLGNGKIITGFNIENASYPVCICAERTALSSALTQYPQEKIAAIAVSYKTEIGANEQPAFPCGVCRQFISECEDRNEEAIPIWLSGQEGEVIHFNSIKDLLPFSFGKKDVLG
jgi:cytidine deaminase